MRLIHVIFPSGAKSTYAEDELRAIWNRGRVQDGTLYWTEGMPDWQPLHEFFGAPPPPAAPAVGPAPSQPSPAATRFVYTSDPRTLTSFLLLMLWVSLGLEIISLLGDFGQYALLAREFTVEEAEANDALQGLIGIGYLLTYIVTAITFLRWTHRANLNCRGFGAEGMTFTPGWAVGYYFIPIINLVRPYQAMKEIWQVSHNPKGWTTADPTGILGLWWTLWLGSNFLGQMTFRLSLRADTIEALQTSTMLSIVSSLVGIPLCIVALIMVRTISNRQEHLVTDA